MDAAGMDRDNWRVFDVRINAAARFVCAPDWSWDTAGALWQDTDLWLVLAGSGLLCTPDRRYHVRRGDCFLLEGGRRYRGSHDPASPLTVIAVHFDLIASDSSDDPVAAPFREHRRIPDPEFLAQCLERVLRCRRPVHRESSADADESARFWLTAALREIRRLDDGDTTDEIPPDARIRQLCDYLRTHPTERREVADLARECGMSTSHFSRVFRRRTGVSPGRFLVRNRIEAAKSLLRDTDHPMKRIAEILGYRDQYFFSRQFRKETGIPPHRYRVRSEAEKLR